MTSNVTLGIVNIVIADGVVKLIRKQKKSTAKKFRSLFT